MPVKLQIVQLDNGNFEIEVEIETVDNTIEKTFKGPTILLTMDVATKWIEYCFNDPRFSF